MHQSVQQIDEQYIRSQVSFHLCGSTAAVREEALYRIASHVDLVPALGQDLSPQERQKTLGWLYDHGYLNQDYVRTQPSTVVNGRVRLKLQTIVRDFGNYEIKLYEGSTPIGIRSDYRKLPKGRNPLMFSETSPLIELEGGERYHFGMKAYEYDSLEKTAVQDKAQLAKLHLYASVGTVQGDIDLVLSHHSPEKHEKIIQTALIGQHRYKRNGQKVHYQVRSVQVMREGMGAYWKAKHSGFIPGTGRTLVIDIGGGSWLYRVVNADGEVIGENVFDRKGAYSLASQIALDERLKSPIYQRYHGITPDPAVVMNGFALGHTYGETGLSWAEWLPEYLDPWYRSILSTLKTECASHLPSVRRFLLTGGSALLIAPKVQGLQSFSVMPDPRFANVIGMYEKYVSGQLAVA
jgi:hypothetical protein